MRCQNGRRFERWFQRQVICNEATYKTFFDFLIEKISIYYGYIKKRDEKDELGTLSRFKHSPVSSARVLKRCTSKVEQISLQGPGILGSISAGRKKDKVNGKQDLRLSVRVRVRVRKGWYKSIL